MVTAEKLAQTLVIMTKEHSAEKAVDVFVKFVTARGLTTLLPDVLEYLKKMERADRHSDRVTIKTAHTVDHSVLRDIENYIKSTGKTEHVVDESLIGGFIAETKTLLFDGSIQGALTRLRQQLLS
jgi:F0F1-type ATP synthase delta subunit